MNIDFNKMFVAVDDFYGKRINYNSLLMRIYSDINLEFLLKKFTYLDLKNKIQYSTTCNLHDKLYTGIISKERIFSENDILHTVSLNFETVLNYVNSSTEEQFQLSTVLNYYEVNFIKLLIKIYNIIDIDINFVLNNAKHHTTDDKFTVLEAKRLLHTARTAPAGKINDN